jgi:transcription antitermination factor NusG
MKTKPYEFTFGQKVRIKNEFFAGVTGEIIDVDDLYREHDTFVRQYKVKIGDREIWMKVDLIELAPRKQPMRRS